MARRISRQQLKRDEVVDAAVDAGHWIENHWRAVAAGAAVVAVAALAVTGWFVWSRHNIEVTEQRLADAIVEFEKLQNDGFADRTAVDAVLLSLEEIGDRVGHTSAGLVARLYRGSGLLQTGRPELASPVLEGVVASAESSLIGPAHGLLASSYQAEGRTDEAIEVLRGLLQESDPAVPADQTLLQLGTLYESAGRKDEAREQFQRIIDEHPSSTAAATARQELAS